MTRNIIGRVATFAAVAATVVMASSAGAQSRLNFVGSVNVSEFNAFGDVLLDFQNPITAVTTVSGTFLPEIVPFVTQGTINDVQVGPGGCLNCPVSPFVTIGGYTFTLNSTPLAPAGPFNFGPIALSQTATGTTASLSVIGTVTGGDFGATVNPFEGLFTAQFTGETPFQVFTSIDAGGTRNVGFSAEFVVSPIPEPATVALMGTGLIALFGVAYRRRTNA
jgi:hypothetical protein